GWNKIVAKEAVDANGDLKNGPTIGTGPFILEKWEANSITEFKKNPDYFLKGLPYIDRLEFPRIKDDQTRFASFRAKQVSHAGSSLTPKDVEMLKAQVPDAQLLRYRSTAPDIEVGMNKRNGPTADKRVRLAISKALNRQEIVDTALQGGGYLFGHFY